RIQSRSAFGIAWGVDSFATIGMDDELSPERGGIMKRTFKFLVVGTAALALTGCASRRLASQGNSPQYAPPPPPRPVYPPPGAIIVPQGSLPPGSIPAGSV